MENASKALIIAGGVLLALMVLSLVVYMSTATSRFAESQDQKRLTEEIKAFNDGYTAYNKKRMYGTDVITIINKAIEHNKTIESIETDPYYINIVIETIEDFKTTGVKNKYDTKKKKIVDEEDMTTDEIIDIGKLSGPITTELGKGTYELGVFSGTNFNINDGMVSFFKNKKSDISIGENKGTYVITYNIYSAITNFKRAIYECKEVHYNPETGRVDKMTFEQIRLSGG